MIRYFFITFSFFFAVTSSYAGELDQRADSAYSAEQYDDAVHLYNEAIKSYGTSAELYYNLGNAYYRAGETAQAILAYERALRMDPQFDNAKANLDFVNTKIVDRPGENGSFISNTFDSMANMAHSNTWSWIALALFTLTIACAATYFFVGSIPLRKLGFFGGIVMFIFTIVSIIMAIHAKNIACNRNIAIIIEPSTILSTSPRTPKNRTEEAMLLHEGTKVYIVDSVSTRTDSISEMWYDVKIDNNHRAWIRSSDVERI